MADKTVIQLNAATAINNDDSIVIAQNEAEAKKVDVALFFTDENSSYAIQSGIHCFDHSLKISGNLSVTGSTFLGDSCEEDELIVNARTTFNCPVTVNDVLQSDALGGLVLGSGCNKIDVSGQADFHCDTNFHENVTTAKDVNVSGNVNVTGQLNVTGNTTLGKDCDDTLTVNGQARFKCNLTVGDPDDNDSTIIFNNDVSGKNFTGNFAYFNSGHFPSGIEVDAPEHADCGCGNRLMAAIWPSDHHAYNIGAASQAFKTIFAQSHYNTSDANKKTNIATSDLGLDFINQLRPVSFKYKPYMSVRGLTVSPDRTRYGLIAQDVKDALDQLGKTTYEFAGYSDSIYADENSPSIKSLDYSQFVGPIIKSIQELSAIVSGLQDQINNG